MDVRDHSLLIALALIPVVFLLQLWIRQRRRSRKNAVGDQEFSSLSATLISTLAEGLAVISSLILVIWIMGAILRYIFPVIFNAR